VQGRIAQEYQKGLMTNSEEALHGLVDWLVASYGLDEDDALHAVSSLLAERQEGAPEGQESLGDVIFSLSSRLRKTTE
jgi:hypothetical protein